MELAQQLVAALLAKHFKIATAESCTGGMVAAAITDIAGSSAVFDRGFVTYSNAAKSECLGVPPALIETHGAVSAEVAIAMAQGALAHSAADIAVSITGIAGPGGGSSAKPVGLVHFAVAVKSQTATHHQALFGNLTRVEIRHKATALALQLVLDQLKDLP